MAGETTHLLDQLIIKDNQKTALALSKTENAGGRGDSNTVGEEKP